MTSLPAMPAVAKESPLLWLADFPVLLNDYGVASNHHRCEYQKPAFVADEIAKAFVNEDQRVFYCVSAF